MLPMFTAQTAGSTGVFAPQYGPVASTGAIGATSDRRPQFGVNIYGTRR